MAQDEAIQAYQRGEIGRVTLVRRLIKCGLSASVALGVALGLAGPAGAAPPPDPGAEGRLNAANAIGNAVARNPNMGDNAANRLNNVENAFRNPGGDTPGRGNPGGGNNNLDVAGASGEIPLDE
jgi:hypothetical protein